MRKLLLAVLVFVPSLVSAQETYSILVQQGSVNNVVDPGRITRNERQCASAGLALTCTTAQIQAVNGFATVEIFPDSLAGRTSFVDEVCRTQVSEVRSDIESWQAERAKITFDTLDATSKNAICSVLGLPNGCNPFP